MNGGKTLLKLLGIFSPIVVASICFSQTLSSKHDLTQAHLGDTAYVVAVRELLLGLRKTSYGITSHVSVETVPLYDMLGSWNIFSKVSVIEFGPAALSLRGGIFYITLEQLPELQTGGLYRYFFGGTASVRWSDEWLSHLNINNTGLHGNVVSKYQKFNMSSKLTNLESDIEYRFNDRQTILAGMGYDLSFQKFSLGGSHVWKWSSLFLKLGMTLRTAPIEGMSVLPFFDLGIRI